MHGGHPIQTYYLGIASNATIAASLAGTAAATVITGSISCTYSQYAEVFNLTGRNLELVIGQDNGTLAYTLTTPGSTPILVGANSQIFCPGTAAAAGAVGVAGGRGQLFPLALQQGMKLSVRTTEATPVTAAGTTPLIIVLWT